MNYFLDLGKSADLSAVIDGEGTIKKIIRKSEIRSVELKEVKTGKTKAYLIVIESIEGQDLAVFEFVNKVAAVESYEGIIVGLYE